MSNLQLIAVGLKPGQIGKIHFDKTNVWKILENEKIHKQTRKNCLKIVYQKVQFLAKKFQKNQKNQKIKKFKNLKFIKKYNSKRRFYGEGLTSRFKEAAYRWDA